MIGASGSGKSSLLKAGVLPQLSRRRREWVVLPYIRPEKAPIETLAKSIAQQIGKPDDWRVWHAMLGGADAIDHVEKLLKDLRVGDARGGNRVAADRSVDFRWRSCTWRSLGELASTVKEASIKQSTNQLGCRPFATTCSYHPQVALHWRAYARSPAGLSGYGSVGRQRVGHEAE